MTSKRRALLAAAAAVAALAVPATADAAVTASFLPSSGTLVVFGDSLGNNITVSRNAAGSLLVNGGAVPILGGSSNVANTALVQVFGQGGSDSIVLNEGQGALPGATLFGGAGNDFLVGGSGIDQLFGQSEQDTLDGRGGDDFVSLGAGNDSAFWTPGAGSDILSGGGDRDRLRLIGSAMDDRFTVNPDGSATRVLHGASGAEVVTSAVEDATISAVGGADTIGVGALNDTDLRTVALDLAAIAGGATGDGQRDRISIAGGDGRADIITLTGAQAAPAASGSTFSVRAGEPTLDTIEVSTGAGTDQVDASGFPAGLAPLTVRGGGDRDLLDGSAAKDVLEGGSGDDRLRGGAANDQLRGGAGDDRLDGGLGTDFLDGGDGTDVGLNGETLVGIP